MDEVRRVLEHVQASDAREVEVSHGQFRLRLKRRPGMGTAASDEPLAVHAAAAVGATIVAPLTGVFYRAASPADAPYADVGDIVRAETVVGLIETMKIFNEVLAEQAGRIADILVESGTLVHAGDALMLVADDDAAGAGGEP